MRYYILKKENNTNSVVGFVNLKNDLVQKVNIQIQYMYSKRSIN